MRVATSELLYQALVLEALRQVGPPYEQLSIRADDAILLMRAGVYYEQCYWTLFQL